MKKILCLLLVGFAMWSCKPTENNYKSAYDVAMQKKARQQTDAEGSRRDFDDMNGPGRQIIDGDTILTSDVRVKAAELSETPGSGPIGVAISKFGMITNARRQAEDLRETEPEVFVALDGDGNHYVVIERCENVPQAAEIIRNFKKRHPGYPFIGLPDSPVTVMVY